MKEYIIAILYVAIFSMLIELILPKSKLKKYILTLIALLLIINIISPVVSILKAKDVEKVLEEATRTMSQSTYNYMDMNSYDFSKYSLTDSVKEKIEKSIKEKFKEENVENVNIILNDEYQVEDIEIKMKSSMEKMSRMKVSKLIQNLSDEYNIVQSKIQEIEVIK